MPFPEKPRVIYAKNPLDKVICQIRFPPILRIEAETPSLFQEEIRTNFPMYSEKAELRVDLPSFPDQAQALGNLRSMSKASINKNHEFISSDGLCKVNLTRTFLALSTNRYTRWEDFKERLRIPIEALLKVYVPAFLTRIGLRYVDIFNRSSLNLKDVQWDELLQPYILGILASPVGSNIGNFESGYDISLSDNESNVRIVSSFLQHLPSGEKCFMIDSDFHNSKRTDIKLLIPKLDFLNSRASRLIQWVIKDKLHDAMEPTAI